MPVYKVMEEMPYDEMMAWISYFETKPIGWREDLRTSYLMRTMGDKRKPQEVFPSLSVLFNAKSSDPMSSLKSSKMFSRMLGAKGGDKLEFLKDS